MSASEQLESGVPVLRPEDDRPFSGPWIVGIGASAGGLKALQQFFQHMPIDSGLVFVIILHLSPQHESNLAGLLQHHTAMPVTQVTEPTHVERNHVYVIPPASHLSLADGTLRLSEPRRPHGQHVAIDLFFRTLAETHGPNAAAVVLSGTGSDGASGLKRVKELGGVTFAQDPQDAEYDSMPRNAIATGLVDFVLPVAALPGQLITYIGNAKKLHLSPAGQSPLADQIDQELQHTKSQLRTTIEQYETSIEELKASNEELQALNEELHSTTEELETSKEELQSINEELHAVNQELKNKIDELSRVNADLHNFLIATDIGTIFLDRALRIVSYTPQAEQLFNLIPADIRRPLAHVTHRVNSANLPADAAQVLERLTTIEREVQRDDGRWYIARLLPYHTVDGRIDGVVLTFVDINQRKLSEHARLEAHRLTELILESISDAYLSIDRDWCGVYANQAAERLLKLKRADILGKDIRRVYAGADIAAFFGQFQQAIDKRATLTFDAYYRSANIWVEMRVFPTSDGGIAIYQRDITERKAAEQHWRDSEERMRLLNENVHDYAIILLDVDGRLIDWNAGAERMFGYTAAEALGQPSALLFTPEDRAAGVPEQEIVTARDQGRAEDERWHLRKDGSRFWVSGVMTAMRDEDGRLRGFAKVARDLTERMHSDEMLRRVNDDLEQRVQQRTTDLAAANQALQREIVERSQAQLARDEVVRQLITAEELQRQRISRELHDQMGQQLTALLLGLQSLKDASRGRPKALATIEQLHNIADQIGSEVHQLALDLRPTALDDLGLSAALANYSADWAQRTHTVVNFHSNGLDTLRPALEIETTIYRVVLEALNNVARHTHAKHISIILERRDNQVIAIVEDDGQGFDTETVISTLRQEHRLGMLGMRERLAHFNGTLTVESTLGSGTTVIARIPLTGQVEGHSDG